MERLEDTMIDIVVLVRDGTTFKPTVKSQFKRWIFHDNELFIASGSTTNYCYIHPRSILEKFITPIELKGYEPLSTPVKKNIH